MSFEARVFRIAIASPSDVEEERAIAVKAIQDWNDLHSADRKAVLLPLRWETHTAPVMGTRPQETINREVIDRADLVVGIFWTRIGSPTGEHVSGTLEEIDRAGSSGKPVMLYFSRVAVDPSSIDLDQLASLRKYQSSSYPQGLVESYASAIEFRDKFARHLQMQAVKLITSTAQSAEQMAHDQPTRPSLAVQFADSKGQLIGEQVDIQTELVHYDAASLPDFDDGAAADKSMGLFSLTNKDYYRQVARREAFRRGTSSIHIAVTNEGEIGAHDVLVELIIPDADQDLQFFSSNDIPAKPSKQGNLAGWTPNLRYSGISSVERSGDEWRVPLDVGTLQPGRTVVTDEIVFIAPLSSGEFTCRAIVYADRLPTPITQELKITTEVSGVDASAIELVPELSK